MSNRNNINYDKYVIYKGTGGLVHMLCGLGYCLEWCKSNRHYLIIDVKSHKCFNHYLKDFFTINNYNNYTEDYNLIISKSDCKLNFQRIPIETIRDYPNVEVEKEENKNSHHYLINNISIKVSLSSYIPEQKIKMYAGPGGRDIPSVLKYIKVKPEIIEIIKEYNEIKEPYLGIHFRNTDINNDINIVINKIKTSKYNYVYLATDDYTADEKIKNALPNINLIQYCKPIKSSEINKSLIYTFDDKYKLVLNILIDMYFLHKSTEFIGTQGSLVSNLVTKMKKTNISIYI
jgi:hypothetical protein